jgi:hypothetical protein
MAAGSGRHVTIGRTKWPLNVSVKPTRIYNWWYPPDLVGGLLGEPHSPQSMYLCFRHFGFRI